ncbi:3-carboxy-cis,cis-muconate cycloisomerase [Streptomyces yaizuensis]|uniref:3-carboxy-cis,cis-muconate cycloisomerase n=1 Tax=Streptomyces yaizuensis TaxID=2989713 RepID=A0ABQ5PAA2_9ACTN|nr:3-carboxy-cis,cis-muconate cycloisomerase [Streptomyces sp. YSPA8]
MAGAGAGAGAGDSGTWAAAGTAAGAGAKGPDRTQAGDGTAAGAVGTATPGTLAAAAGVCADTGLLSPVRAGTPVEAATDDHAWIQAMLDAEAALARAQARLGALPKEAADAITAAAHAGLLDARALALASRETANPVVGLIAAFTEVVAARDPAAVDHIHRGSTSQDILDTGTMLVAARALAILRADLLRIADALGGLAHRHRDTTMAGRTLALQAVPTTFGLKAAGWRDLVLDAEARVARLLHGGLPVSLGGAAGTLAGYLEYAVVDGATAEDDPDAAGHYLDRLAEAFAAETALAVPRLPWHALRTPVADLAAVLAFTAGALGKIAVDVQSLARTEVGEVAEPGPEGRGGSSAMPHKRNPVLSTLIRSAALQVPVLAAGLTQCMLAEDERSAGAWHAEWSFLREALRLTGGAAHTAVELATGLSVHADRMRDNLAFTGGQVVTERLAAHLAPSLGKAAAKQLLSRCSAKAVASGRPLPEVLVTQEEIAGRWSRDELADLCDPDNYTGGAAPLVDRALLRTPVRGHTP